MLKKTSLVTMLVVLVFCSCVSSSTDYFPKSENVLITSPQYGSKIGLKCLVRGKISNHSGGNVYALVRPAEKDLWYVQCVPSVIDEDGSWQALCFFGTKSEGKNQYYEIIAIITNETLKKGQTIKIKNLPQDAVKSALLTVERTDRTHGMN